jgi:hypothetical protein
VMCDLLRYAHNHIYPCHRPRASLSEADSKTSTGEYNTS